MGGKAAAVGHDRRDLEMRRSGTRHKAEEVRLVGDDKLTCPVPRTFPAQAVGYQENGVKRVCLSPVR